MTQAAQPYPSLTPEEANRFRFHPATETTGPRHDQVRELALKFAEDLTRLVPPGRHRACALTAAQEAMMWANAGIACDTPPEG
jgi:hypothetical protein